MRVPTITLQHCVPVTVFSCEVPSILTIDLAVAGSPGDGAAQLLPTPGPMAPSGPLGAGSSKVFNTAGCTELKLHYIQAPGGPSSIQVTYSLTVS